MKYRFYIFLLLAVMCGSFIACEPVVEVYGLRCESLEDPLAIDNVRPHFSWCICLKKVDSQKESIIMTPHTEFQKKYYQQVIEIHQKTGFSPRKIAKLQLVPVSVRQMYHWIAIFEAENGKGSPRRIMEAKKSKEQEELESLKSRISELEESLRVERLRNRLNEKIIDIAEARWHIEIRKKAGTKR